MIRPRSSEGMSRLNSRRLARFFFQLALLLGVQCLVILIIWMAGFLWFYTEIHDETVDLETPTEAVVVLTGGSKRLAAGLDLLAEGKGRKLFISGVNRGVSIEELLRSYNIPSRLTCCIELGYAADDTTGNASETKNWIRWEGYTSLRLVTSNYHMPRSLLEFQAAMPEVTIVPYPVIPDTLRSDSWPERWTALRLIAHEYTKYLLARVRLWISP